MSTALIVEDDASVRGALSSVLATEGFRVIEAGTGGEAIAKFNSEDPDVVVLDVMLPDGSGFDVCRQVREVSAVPVLMLTALADESNVVRGFHAGADDYVAKPFRPRELIARLRSILRRVGAQDEAKNRIYAFEEITFYPDRQTVERDGQTITLSPTENGLLTALLINQGKVLLPQEIAEEVWHCQIGEREAQDLVKTTISRLRNKIEPDRQNPRYIRTVRGRGYTLGL